MSYDVFSQRPDDELPKEQLESENLKGVVKTINIVLYAIGLLLILFNFIGPMVISQVSFARTGFDFYEVDPLDYNFSMYEDNTNYVLYVEVDGVDYFDLYDKESGNVTHDIITLALGETYDGTENVQRYMYENGYTVVSNFTIVTLWFLVLPAGVIFILIAFINHRNNVDKGVRKFRNNLRNRRVHQSVAGGRKKD